MKKENSKNMINCIVLDDDLISRKLIEAYSKKASFLNLLHSFQEPISALSFLSENSVDLIFLDIEMPEMNGMKFIQTIQQKMPQVIIVTTHTELAHKAFEYEVTDFLVKPFDYSRFYKAVLRAKNIAEKDALHYIDDDNVFIKKGSSIVRIKKSDIIWVQALGDYITLNTEKEKIIIHSSMNAMEAKLSQKHYIRVHRSYIIRIDKIESIEDDIISYNEKIFPIGKTYRNYVYQRLKMI